MIIFTVSLITFFLVGFGIAFGGNSAGIVGGMNSFVGIYNSDGYYSER
jgi:ammonia channel protein AmtB